MSHLIIEDRDLRHIEIIHKGKLTREEVKDCKNKILNLVESNNSIFILCDLMLADFKASISDMYYGPENFSKMKFSKSSRFAILLPGNHQSWREVKFLETVSINRGWRLKLFSNKETAIEWLNA